MLKAPKLPSEPTRTFTETAVHHYDSQLHRFLRRRIRHAQDLDDVVQETYLRLLRVKDTDNVLNPLAYVFGVAAHVVREFNLRKHARRVDFDSMEMEIAADHLRAEWPVEGGGYFERRVNEALAQLPEKKLAVLLLERRDGLSQGEIAERLDLSIHTVKKYRVESLAHIRCCLEHDV